MISCAKYIKASLLRPQNSTKQNPSPRFRKGFTLSCAPVKATLCCAGLGCGYFYINGKKVSEDLFTAPVSDYLKTVWYCTYDVTDLLQVGQNVLAAILGNGFYNETVQSIWEFHTAPWRDVPKLIAELSITMADGSQLSLVSDESWLCSEQSPYIFNGLRSGETYDARLYEDGWNEVNFDDSGWKAAYLDPIPPTGVLRPCTCAPIREFEHYLPVEIRQLDDGYLFCFPQNISGYVCIRTGTLKAGQHLQIRYAEGLDDQGKICFFKADSPTFYPEGIYAYSEFIADGRDFYWRPRFSYYGFRYVKITGLTQMPEPDMVQAVFVHQAIDRKSSFACSDRLLNRLYHMGIQATLSNMFYMPTDCPTREKLGWGNDAQASTEQFLINFRCVDVLTKWFRDILDSQRPDGAVPGIIPSSGWGYESWAGPISSGILFEIPWRIYQYTGDSTLLTENTDAFRKHLRYIISRANERGFPDYGLCDWAGPWGGKNKASPVPSESSDTLLYIKFLRITRFALGLKGETAEDLLAEEKRMTLLYVSHYFKEDGTFLYPYQSGLSMCLMLDISPDPKITARELVEAVERDNRHLNCGMLGTQYLFDALDKIGRSDLAWDILTAKGYPSYLEWITNRDATTFCETFEKTNSQNHHMYTNVMAWMMKRLAGIRPTAPGFSQCEIHPWCHTLDYCRASQDTPLGRLCVDWQKEENNIRIAVTIPKGMEATLVTEKKRYQLYPGVNTHLVAREDIGIH